MRKSTILIVAVILSLVFVAPVFAGNSNGNGSNTQNGSIHHNTIANGGNVNSKISNTNRNTNVGINKNTNVGINKNTNLNTNKNVNKNDIDINNKVNNKVDVDTTDVNVNVSKNKQKQDQKQNQLQAQKQSANNKQAQAQDASNAQGQSTDINIDGDEDNSVYMAPPATTAVVGTSSAQVTTPFGGVGFSKDAQYAVYKYKMDVTEEAFKRGYITEEERVKKGKYLYKKFISANKKGILSNIIDPIF